MGRMNDRHLPELSLRSILGQELSDLREVSVNYPTRKHPAQHLMTLGAQKLFVLFGSSFLENYPALSPPPRLSGGQPLVYLL